MLLKNYQNSGSCFMLTPSVSQLFLDPFLYTIYKSFLLHTYCLLQTAYISNLFYFAIGIYFFDNDSIICYCTLITPNVKTYVQLLTIKIVIQFKNLAYYLSTSAPVEKADQSPYGPSR